MAALAARPSASIVRPDAAAAAPGVVVAVVTAALIPPVEVAAVAVATMRALVGSRIGSRIVVLIRPRLVSPLLRPVP